MRAPTTSLELLEPRSLEEALWMMRRNPGIVPIAGCTDVFVGLNFGTCSDKKFLNLWSLHELRTIEMKDKKTLAIGALATFTQIIRSPLVKKRLPILVEAARTVGGAQIQNRGTIGGNIANASPAGDTLPVLAVADAVVVLQSADGPRRVAFNEFYTGYKKTQRRADELIVAVEIPPVAGRQCFRKVGTRAAQAISKVVMAAVVGKSPRVAVGSVAPTVVRLPKTESLLAAGGTIEEARRVLLDEIKPIDDLRSTAAYRKCVAANVLEQFWRHGS